MPANVITKSSDGFLVSVNIKEVVQSAFLEYNARKVLLNEITYRLNIEERIELIAELLHGADGTSEELKKLFRSTLGVAALNMKSEDACASLELLYPNCIIKYLTEYK